MKKLACTLTLIFAILFVCGQDVTHNLSRQEANILLKSLNQGYDDTARVNSLLKLAQFNILKPGSLKADLDSAALFIKQAKSISEKISPQDNKGYITLVDAFLYGEEGKRDTERKYIETAISILKNSDDKLHLGQAYFELSGYYKYRDHTQSAEKIRLVEQAVACYQKSGHTELIAYTLKFLSDLYNLHGEPLKALQTIKSSLGYYSAIHYKTLQGVYVVFGQIYYRLGDYRKSLDYAILALKTAELMKDTSMQVSEINNQIGISLGDLSEYNRAIAYFKEALNIAIRNKDYDGSYEMAGNVVENYLKLNRPTEALNFFKDFTQKIKAPKDEFYDLITADTYLDIYNKLRIPSLGKPYYNQLMVIDNNPHMTDGIRRNIYPSMIVFYIISKQYPMAKELIIKYQTALEKIKDPIAAALRYKYDFMVDTAMGNYRSAVDNLLKNKNINDSLYTEGKSKQLQNFLAQYETDKKESEIKILNQKNELQQNSLQKANFLKDVTFGGVLLLSVIIALLYRQYRLKQKGNLITQENNVLIMQKNELLQHLLKEKEWLLKEVHHRVKNNLHTVICLLESQAAYLENDALKAIEIASTAFMPCR
jgi:tetratricopeptide (TPR) repeat protein